MYIPRDPLNMANGELLSSYIQWIYQTGGEKRKKNAKEKERACASKQTLQIKLAANRNLLEMLFSRFFCFFEWLYASEMYISSCVIRQIEARDSHIFVLSWRDSAVIDSIVFIMIEWCEREREINIERGGISRKN